VRMIFKGNNEHNYSYVGGDDGLRRTCSNPRVHFDTNYVGDMVQVEDMLDVSHVIGTS